MVSILPRSRFKGSSLQWRWHFCINYFIYCTFDFSSHEIQRTIKNIKICKSKLEHHSVIPLALCLPLLLQLVTIWMISSHKTLKIVVPHYEAGPEPEPSHSAMDSHETGPPSPKTLYPQLVFEDQPSWTSKVFSITICFIYFINSHIRQELYCYPYIRNAETEKITAF